MGLLGWWSVDSRIVVVEDLRRPQNDGTWPVRLISRDLVTQSHDPQLEVGKVMNEDKEDIWVVDSLVHVQSCD
jgi:hypothetical protein